MKDQSGYRVWVGGNSVLYMTHDSDETSNIPKGSIPVPWLSPSSDRVHVQGAEEFLGGVFTLASGGPEMTCVGVEEREDGPQLRFLWQNEDAGFTNETYVSLKAAQAGAIILRLS